MEEVSETKRFFKIMMPGFHQILNLPPAVCKKLKLERSSVEVVVKSCTGTWKMETCRNQELGLICFKDGWPNFVQGHGLSIGDFVVFEHKGNFHFNAVVFDTSGCEKEYNLGALKKDPKDAPSITTKREAEEKSAKSMSHQRKNPFFIKTMMPYNGKAHAEMCIPAKFWRSKSIGEKANVVLRDPSGRDWPVKLTFQKNTYNMRGKITKGWRDFYVGNKLKVGDVCDFELITSNNDDAVMAVEIFPAPL